MSPSTIPLVAVGIPVLVVALVFLISLAAVVMGRDRRREALREAEGLRRAIESGRHRGIEARLRRQLRLAAAGEVIPIERQWLLRAQLGGLLVAEWRLDEAAAVYGDLRGPVSPLLQALAAYGHLELAVLRADDPAEFVAILEAIARDRTACLELVPANYEPTIARAWDALEGLGRARAGDPQAAIPLLERGLPALEYNPARVVYLFHLAQALEQVGELAAARVRHEQAMLAFPGTRLADESRARLRALTHGRDAAFRGMLPEAPRAASSRPEEDPAPEA